MQNVVENPDKIIGGGVVKYTDSEGNESIVALSEEFSGNLTYVANKPGNYSLVYNTKKYDDIAGHWSYATTMYVSNRELFGGTSPTEFSPDMPMTRGMFITVLGRMYNIDTSVYSGEVGYIDVNADEYYAPYIKWAAEEGIIDSHDGRFFPEEPITRSDMALYIAAFINKYGYSFPEVFETTQFDDISELDDNVQKAITDIRKAGIINGKAEGIFDPDGISTRAEVAAVMARLIKSILGKELYFFSTSEESMEFKELPRDRLRFGAYVPHPMNSALLTEKHIRTIHEAGIDFTVVTGDYKNAMLEKMGNWYEKYGIEYVYQGMDSQKYASDGITRIFDKENVKAMDTMDKTIPFAGLSMVDEPGVAMYPEIGQAVKDFYEVYPDEIAFINLLPYYANEAQLTEGAWADEIEYYEGEPATYKTYLEEYVKQVPTPFICVDIYPCYGNKRTYSDYCKAIEFVADACRESGIDFWIFNQCCFWNAPQYVIDETDIYWQGYTVLSFGAKSILYYIFSALYGHYDTPLDENGEPNATYYAMQKFHEEIRRFDEKYLSYNSLGAFSINTENAPWAQLNNQYEDFETITGINCNQPLLVGCFEAKDKKSTAFMLANQADRIKEADGTANVELELRDNVNVIAYIDGIAQRIIPDENGLYHFTLKCGRGVFVTVE